MIDITPIINAVILLVASIVTVVIVPKVRAVLIAKIGEQQTNELCRWIDIFVGAAEQCFADPEKKKSYVVEKLEDMGYTVNDEVNGIIESAVLQLHAALRDY
ncbi:MAG: hypothetical protein KBS60_04200 [Phascolarctobacterium sp.]|nr:hypothetical protein [Candidatus Phascolarctobacterium caballi]